MRSPQFALRTCRPRDHLAGAAQMYPHAWRLADQIRAARGQGLPDWPAWCYIPMSGVYEIVAQDAGVPSQMLGIAHPERIPDIARLAALITWRMTQGIYRLDPAVYDAVRDTPVERDIPADVLYHLPEWCVYVETPGMRLGGTPIVGVFAHLEADAGTGRAELRLLLDVGTAEDMDLIPVALHLGAWTLAESIGRMLDAASATSMARGAGAVPRATGDMLRPVVEPIVSLLLYIASQAAEIGDDRRRPGNPVPVRTRRDGWRLFAAQGATTWDVGARMGAALRAAYAAEETGAGSGHAGPRPHVRRAHWHGFWSGPREGARRFDLRWLPPIPVNLPDVDALAAIVAADRT